MLEVISRIAVQMLGLPGIDQPMQHQGIQREKRPSSHDILISLPVAVSNPLLTPAAYSRKTVVFSSSPDRIGIQQPKRRRIGAGGEIDVKVWFLCLPVLDQTEAAAKTLLKMLPGKTLSTLPVPSTLN